MIAVKYTTENVIAKDFNVIELPFNVSIENKDIACVKIILH
jgi:hypothetical protein